MTVRKVTNPDPELDSLVRARMMESFERAIADPQPSINMEELSRLLGGGGDCKSDE